MTGLMVVTGLVSLFTAWVLWYWLLWDDGEDPVVFKAVRAGAVALALGGFALIGAGWGIV